ncbi:fungal-specific transcription factor domain-containing protein [Xylogone sp. PMI_703]|nr:fungal-specific transcription factor domain-containing protein [Xylogone sp. PMI_703]
MDPNTPESESAPPDDSADSSYAPSGPARTSCDLCKRMKQMCHEQKLILLDLWFSRSSVTGKEKAVHDAWPAVSRAASLLQRERSMRKGEIFIPYTHPCIILTINSLPRGNALLAVESRIKRLESVLTASGINPNSSDSPAAESEAPSDLSDRLSTLLIDEKGTSHFLGPSSAFSLFSPQGLQWINDRTGSNELSQFISTLTQSSGHPVYRGPSELWYTLAPSEREPLPPKELAERYVLSYLDTFNSCFPLFDREVFLDHFERQYSGNPPQGVAWYACINVVLCMGSLIEKFEILQTIEPGFDSALSDLSWRYFRNACSCFVDLVFKESNLMAVQALCGMAFVQQTILDPQPYLIVTAAAARLAHGMGLHRTFDEFRLTQKEITQRRNVFWMVYLMDKSISLRIGHPSVITDNDIGVGLPPEIDPNALSIDGSKKFNIFRYQAQLALLESRIYSELYSIRSRNRAIADRLRSVGQLDKALQDWRASLPPEIQSSDVIKCSKEQFIPVVFLHFSYLNCMATVHRISAHHGASINVQELQAILKSNDHQLSPRVFQSQQICLSAARSSVRLLQCLDLRESILPCNLIWVVMYYALASFLTLFANTLQCPQDTHAESDLELMSIVATIIGPAAAPPTPFKVAASIRIFLELRDVAVKFVHKMRGSSPQPAKRSYAGYEMELIEEKPVSQDSGTTSNVPTPSNTLGTPDAMNLGTPDAMSSRLSSPYRPRYNTPDMTSQATPSPESQQVIDNIHTFLQQPHLTENEFVSFNEPLFSDINFQEPATMGDQAVFSQSFEYDLLNLWNQGGFNPMQQ